VGIVPRRRAAKATTENLQSKLNTYMQPMKKLMSLLSLAAVSVVMMATPAKRGVWKTVTLADGSTVRVELRGDEYMSYWQAEDGRCFVKQAEGELYEEADRAEMTLLASNGARPLPCARRRSVSALAASTRNFPAQRKD